MAGTWKTVRVFISSTFRDMHAERDHLVKVVFPDLRERLTPQRIELIDIDLRWGVTREQAENDQALDVCLHWIDQCRPFFIGILGDRYGWVPPKYPEPTRERFRSYGQTQLETRQSITELEILFGVLLMDPTMRGRSFFYFRDPRALYTIPIDARLAVYAETDHDRVQMLAKLKERIRRSSCPVYDGYPARWDPDAYDRPTKSRGRLVGLDEFGRRVRDQLLEAVKQEFSLPIQPSLTMPGEDNSDEADEHERFMESRLRVYVGRQDLHEALIAFADGEDAIPLLVTGPAGSGKSAALARFVTAYRQSHSDVCLLHHFVGASPRSTGLRDVLRRLFLTLSERFGLAVEVPERLDDLTVAFGNLLGHIPSSTRTILVIDALDQLDDSNRAQDLYWLPTRLPSQLRVVVSCISDATEAGTVLDALARRGTRVLKVDPFTNEERRLVIEQVPSLSAKSLDARQQRLLLDNPATSNPLFLLVALEELRGFGSYERLDALIAGLPREGDTLTALFLQVIERLEEEFDAEVVRQVLTFLSCARRGLSERELHEILTGLSGRDDLYPILRQLRPYLLSRAGLIDFYHRGLLKAVRVCYLNDLKTQRVAHASLAAFFGRRPLFLANGTPVRRPNDRRVDEQPWQLLQAGQDSELEQLLTDLTFLNAKCEASMIHDLQQDYFVVLENWSGKESDRPTVVDTTWIADCLQAVRDGLPDPHPDKGSGLVLARLHTIREPLTLLWILYRYVLALGRWFRWLGLGGPQSGSASSQSGTFPHHEDEEMGDEIGRQRRRPKRASGE